MKETNSSLNLAQQYMMMDIIEKITKDTEDPNEMTNELLRNLSELFGGQLLAVVLEPEFVNNLDSNIFSRFPKRRGGKLDDEKYQKIISKFLKLKDSTLIDEKHFLYEEVSGLGYDLSLVIPLYLKKKKIASIIIFGIFSSHRVARAIHSVDIIAGFVSGIIKQAVSFNTQRLKLHKKRKELSETSNFLNIILDISPTGIIRFNIEKEIKYMNKSARDILEKNYVGENWRSIFQKRYYSNIEKTFKDNSRAEVMTSNGTWIILNIKKEINLSGEVKGYIGSLVKIDELKNKIQKLRLSKAKYKSLVDNIELSVILINKDREILDFNPAAMKLFPKIEVGIKCYEAIAERKEGCTYCVIGKDKKIKIFEKIIDGKKHYFRFTISSDISKRTNNRIYIDIIEDITEDVLNKKKLIMAKNKSQEANKAKSQFLANMSHELRTPMNGILGMAQLLELTELTEEQLDYIEDIKYSGDHLLDIINDILNLTRIENGKLNLNVEKFNIQSFFEKIVRFFNPISREKGLKFNYNIDPTVPKILEGDVRKIRQIIINIIGNSIKYTNKGWINFSLINNGIVNDEITIIFKIQDTGIGIPENKKKVILEPFVQGDLSYTKEYQGAGLGLSISNQLVKLMGGKITLESKELQGTTFNISIPLKIVKNI